MIGAWVNRDILVEHLAKIAARNWLVFGSKFSPGFSASAMLENLQRFRRRRIRREHRARKAARGW